MPADFLQLEGRRIAVFGVANRKSVAFHVGQVLKQAGAEPVYVVRNDQRRESVAQLLDGDAVFVCDVECPEQIDQLAAELATRYGVFHGLVHSIAFGDYSEGPRPFHETSRSQMLRAFDISCFSLVALANAFKDLFSPDSSVLAIIDHMRPL